MSWVFSTFEYLDMWSTCRENVVEVVDRKYIDNLWYRKRLWLVLPLSVAAET